MIAVGVGILVALVATVVFFVVYNSSRKGWQQSLAVRESEAADLKVRNGVLEAQVKSCTARLVEVQAQLDFANREREKLNREKGDLQARNQMLSENMEVQKQEVQRIRQEMNNEFKVLANEILQEKSKSFSEMNHERLAEILNPLKERLEGFKKTVEETYNNEARERFSLKEQIKELVERSESIGEEAKQLTHALRGDSKIQGDWGEMILESILEKSGLEKDREYFRQETLRDEEGHTIQGSDGRKMRPDVIIRYPGGENHQMVIDSKVSLTAYVNYVNAEDADEARLALKQHLVSVRKHIDELAGKSYQDYVGKGDHVMMFIPNEAAYLAAMQADHALWQYAYEKKVLLLSPTNLIAALKLVADLWQRDKQTRNAIDIAEEGGKLYDKFAGFVEDMEKIGKSLNTTAMAYTDAMKKLKTGNGNLIGRVEKLKVMGVKAKKNLPAVNEEEEEN
jgi:rmuC domain protein